MLSPRSTRCFPEQVGRRMLSRFGGNPVQGSGPRRGRPSFAALHEELRSVYTTDQVESLTGVPGTPHLPTTPGAARWIASSDGIGDLSLVHSFTPRCGCVCDGPLSPS